MNTELWKKYSEQFGARFTGRQKKGFTEAICADFKEIGYDYELIKGRKFLKTCSNIMFGNIKHAKTVIVVPYDTPQKVFWPKSYFYPLDGMATSNKTVIPVFGPVLVIYLILMAMMYGMESFVQNAMNASIFMSVILVLILFLFYFMLHGITNRKNFNRNSASIYAALEIAKTLDKDKRRQVAFLFLDSNKGRHLGAKVAAEDFLKQSKNPNIIAFNAFALGSQMQIGYNNQNKKLAQDLNKGLANAERIKMMAVNKDMANSSIMEHFQKAVIIGAGENDKKGRLCVMHTGSSKDTEIQEDNISKVINMVKLYLK